MIATLVNCVLVLLGSAVGLLFRNRISARFSQAVTSALGLCVLGIGVTSAVATENTLCVIVCMVAGTLLGVALRIEERLDGLGERLRRTAARAASPKASSPPPCCSAWAPWRWWAPWRRASIKTTPS